MRAAGLAITDVAAWLAFAAAGASGHVGDAPPPLAPTSRVLMYETRHAHTNRLLYTSREWTEPWANGGGQTVAIVAVTFPNGETSNERMVLTDTTPPRCVMWERTIRDGRRAVVGSRHGCTQNAFPFVGRPLPEPVFPAEAPIGHVVTRLALTESVTSQFHVVSTDRALVPLDVWIDKRERVEVPAKPATAYCSRTTRASF